VARLSLVPGIDAVAVAQGTPMMGGELGWRVVLPGEDPSTAIPSDYADVSAGYFDAVGIRLVSGRGFLLARRFEQFQKKTSLSANRSPAVSGEPRLPRAGC
jgi:hypothetical protein